MDDPHATISATGPRRMARLPGILAAQIAGLRRPSSMNSTTATQGRSRRHRRAVTAAFPFRGAGS